MTFPVVASRTNTDVNADGNSHAVSLGSLSAGDLIVVFSAFDGSPTISIDTAASGKNWLLFPQASNSGAVTSVVACKVAEGGDVLTYVTDEAERSGHIAYKITGHGSSVYATSSNGSSTNGDPPNQAITGSAQDVLWLAALCTDAQVVASAAPSGYGTLTTQTAASSNGASVSVAEKTANASSENPGAFTNTTEQWVAWTVAIPSVNIPTNARASQVVAEAVSQVDPALLASQLVVEVLSANALHMIASQIVVEMVSENVPDDVAGDAAIIGAFI